MSQRRRETSEPFELANAAAASVRTHLDNEQHDVAVILGSGWAAVADELGDVVAEVELSTLPGFPPPRVHGHRDLARSVVVGDQRVLLLAGRVHLYEGFSASEVVHGVRTASAAGCTRVILTNAAGAINPSYSVARPVLLSDQLNLTGTSPMAGPPPPDGFPGRFCDMTDAYSPALRSVALSVDPTLHVGIYAGLFGGAYETPSEVRMLAKLGADLVGMSTVLETIAARHLDMEVLGISLVTNMAAGITGKALAHAEVLETAASARDTISQLIRSTIIGLS